MYLEEKIINGILHYRTSPNEEFKPYTLENLTGKIEMLKEEIQKQQGYTQEKVFEIERYRAIDFAKWFSDFNGLTWEEKRVTKERLDTLYEKYLGTLGGGI
jgi:recombination DNA repair RAD52 pathway protein